MSNTLTLHILVPVEYGNLNRDETGTPKRVRQGNVQRALLSSQSIKRAARTDYELASMDTSYRSANLAELVLERAKALNPNLDEKAAQQAANKLVGQLTKKGATGADDSVEPGRSTWLSSEELDVAALRVVDGSDEGFVEEGKSGALAIAAFGRMFAAEPKLQTEAAISVSPAVSTHEAIIETDYFSTVDDNPSEKQGSGATYLGIAAFTTSVMYRSVTIDRKQLQTCWTGMAGQDARNNLAAMITSLVYKLPSGKSRGTAPYTYPLVVLAEEQNYRMAYDFETPVDPGKEGGFGLTSVERLVQQRALATAFDPDNYPGLAVVSGTAEPNQLESFNLPVVNLPELREAVVDWILS